MFSVALIGADGAGKTTVARHLAAELPMPATYLYMGENPDASSRVSPPVRLIWGLRRVRGKLPASGGPPPLPGADAPARSRVRTWLHMAILLTEEWYRQLLTWRYVRNGTVVVFDRHFYPDYYAHDITGGGQSFAQRVHGFLLTRLYPKPDLTIVLDAPADVLLARKAEGTLESLDRRRREYLEMPAFSGEVAVVDASRPLDDVQSDVSALVRAFAVRHAAPQ